MSYSDYLENKITDALCNNTALAVAQVYTKLHIGDPGEAGTANAAAETTRKATSFGASSAGVCASDASTDWTVVAGTETYTHVSYWDASTAGNCLGAGALAVSKAVVAGDSFSFAIGSLTFTSTGYSTYALDKINDAVCNNVSFAVATPFMKLHIGAPGAACTANPAGETTRKATSYGASSGGVATSDAQIQWTNVASTESYSHFSLWDAATVGNALIGAAFSAAVAVTAGDTFTIASGQHTVTSA